MAQESRNNWEGKLSVKLRGREAEKVWPLVEDFCNIHKWLPSIDTCYKVEGVQGQPGIIRYCGTTIRSDGCDESITMWCHEKLIDIDQIQRWLTYEIMENNMGFKMYKSTLKVMEMEGGDESGCEIKWWFVAEPVDGWKFEDLVRYIESSLHGMAERMEKALESDESDAPLIN